MFRRRCRRALAAVLLAGCYTLQPVQGPTPDGRNGDRLRHQRRRSRGPRRLDGSGDRSDRRTAGARRDRADYLVAVSAVHLLRGGEQVWCGEPVRIKSEYVASVYERKFSAVKSIALGAVGVGVVAAIIATPSIIGGGTADPCKRSRGHRFIPLVAGPDRRRRRQPSRSTSCVASTNSRCFASPQAS